MTLELEDAFVEGEFANVPLGMCRPHIVDAGTTLPGRSRYFIVFRHRYLDFRLAEVQALAEVGYGKQGCYDHHLLIKFNFKNMILAVRYFPICKTILFTPSGAFFQAKPMLTLMDCL